MRKLKVKATQNANVTNYEAIGVFPPRFIGKQFDHETNNYLVLEEIIEVPDTNEYRAAIKALDLLPADKETAIICNVDFKTK